MQSFTDRIIKLDLDLSGKLALWEKDTLWRKIAIAITHSGDALPVIIAYGVAFLLASPRGRGLVLVILAADMLTLTIVQIMKRRVKRPRPEGTWGKTYRTTDPNSFPSGHSARGGVIAGMALLLGPPWFAILGVVWGMAVALSRVLMGVHYVSDMIVGFSIGLGVAALFALILPLVGII